MLTDATSVNGTAKAPPHDLLAEESVLGAVLVDNLAFERAGALLPTDFYRSHHRKTYSAMARLVSRGAPIDFVTLAAEIGDDLRGMGGAAWIAELSERVPTSANVEHYAAIVRLKARLRTLQRAGQTIALAAEAEDWTALQDALGAIPADELLASSAGRFALITDADLENVPIRSELVKNTFPAGGLIALVSHPGAMKTTFALDLACRIRTSKPFHHRGVQPGDVVFVAAEGASSLGARTRAWRASNNVEAALGILFVTEPVRFGNEEDVRSFLAALAEKQSRPGLVVVDTVARCMVGADENSAKDMGAFIAGVDRVRLATGAAVLLIHHLGKSGMSERGSSALRGAVDTLAVLSREDDVIRVICEKQKDSAPFEPLFFRSRVIDLDDGQSACVLDPIDRPESSEGAPFKLPASRVAVLEALQDCDDGATFSHWLRLAQQTARVSDSTFQRAVTDLTKWGLVTRRGQKYFAKQVQQS